MSGNERRRDLKRQLDAADGTLPSSWIPRVGDTLSGTLVRYDRGRTQFGGAHIAVIKDDQTGELRACWLVHHVLREKFKEERPKPGEWLGVKRLPDAERGYKRYALVLDRGGEHPEMPNFEEFGPATDEPVQPLDGE